MIWQGGDPIASENFKRKLMAVLSGDVAWYSRLMAEDLATLHQAAGGNVQKGYIPPPCPFSTKTW